MSPSWSYLKACEEQEEKAFHWANANRTCRLLHHSASFGLSSPEHRYFLGPALKLSYFSPFLHKVQRTSQSVLSCTKVPSTAAFILWKLQGSLNSPWLQRKLGIATLILKGEPGPSHSSMVFGYSEPHLGQTGAMHRLLGKPGPFCCTNHVSLALTAPVSLPAATPS